MLPIFAAVAFAAIPAGQACLDLPARESAYVLDAGGSRSVCGGSEDVSAASRALNGDGLWIRLDGEAWLLRDPVDVRDAAALLAPRSELGTRLGAISGKQVVLGDELSALEAERARLAAQHAGYRARAGEADAAAKSSVVAAKLDEIGKGLDRLRVRLAALEAERSSVAGDLGRSSDDARLGLSLLVDRALRNGTAISVR